MKHHNLSGRSESAKDNPAEGAVTAGGLLLPPPLALADVPRDTVPWQSYAGDAEADGVGIVLPAGSPSQSGSITGTVTGTVRMGSPKYSATLTLTGTGQVYSPTSGKPAIEIGRHVDNAMLTNYGNIGAKDGVALMVAGASATILNSGNIYAHDGTDALASRGVSATILNSGFIDGIYSTGNHLDIVNTGSISNSYVGIHCIGSATIENYGQVYGGVGVRLNGAETLLNSGSIQGGYNGAHYSYFSDPAIETFSPDARIINSGDIAAGQSNRYYFTGTLAIGMYGGYLLNSGTISGSSGNHIYSGGDGVDINGVGQIVNGGTIRGGDGGSPHYPFLQAGNGGAGVALLGAENLVNSGTIEGGGGGGFRNEPKRAGSGGTGVLVNGGTLTNTGTIEGGIGIVGHDGVGVLVNQGTLICDAGTISGGGYGGSYGAAVAFGGAGVLIVDAGAQFIGDVAGNASDLLAFTAGGLGTLSGLGSQFTGFGTISFAPGSYWTMEGANKLANGQQLQSSGTLTVDASFTNAGAVQVNDGVMTFSSSLNNSGTISVEDAKISCKAAVGGTGLFQVGDSGDLRFLDGVGAHEAVDFTGDSGLVVLDVAHSLDGQFADFAAGDIIDLINPPSPVQDTGFAYQSGTLTIYDGSSVVATLLFNGTYNANGFAVGSDGHGGLAVTYS